MADNIGEFYADWDEDTNSWCVFHTETSKAYASYSDKGNAEDRANELNKRAAEYRANSRNSDICGY